MTGFSWAAPPSLNASTNSAQLSVWPTDPTFERLGRAQGLPNGQVTSIVEDARGFIWMGTASGLARWDGYRFKVFRAEADTPGSLQDELIQSLHVDAAGTIWVGTNSAGLARFDDRTERFVTYPVGGENGISYAAVRSMADDGNGGLWIGTRGGLDHLDPANGRITHAAELAPEGKALAGAKFFAMLRDKRGDLWAGTSVGFLRRSRSGGRFEVIPLVPDSEDQPLVSHIAQDSVGRIWVGTFNSGVFLIDPAQSGYPLALAEDAPPDGKDLLRIEYILGMAEIRPGEMWIGTGQGVVEVDLTRRRTKRIQPILSWPLSLPEAIVSWIHRDRSGQIWVATNAGVARHDPLQLAATTRFGLGGSDPNRKGVAVQGTMMMPDGHVWLSTHGGEIEIVSPDGKHFRTISPDTSRPNTALPSDMVSVMAYASDGKVYIGAIRGLYKASPDGSQMRRVELKGRADVPVLSLVVDGDILWIGGADGLWQLNTRTGVSRHMLQEPHLKLIDERINRIVKGGDGYLWLLTRNGMGYYSPSKEAIERYSTDPTSARRLSTGWVNCLIVDSVKNRILVGTYGAGFDVFPLQPSSTVSTVRLTTAQGLPSNSVDACIEDGDRRQLGVSTEDGLAVIDMDSLAITPLQRAEGAVFPEYWENALRTDRGEWLFGGSGGVTLVHSDRLKPWTYRPPVVVTDLQVGGRRLPAGAFDEDRPVQIMPAANSLTVEFAALDYTAPERNRYAYKLEGYDESWIETDATRRLASYTNLSPGNYRLMLLGSNRAGAWSEPTLGVVVNVLPAWHQTWWFRACLLLLAMAFIAAVVHMRTRWLQARQIDLERSVRVRTAELEIAHQTLREKSELLERSSMVDTLTGLYNREFLVGPAEHDLNVRLKWSNKLRASDDASAEADSIFFLIEVDQWKRMRERHGQSTVDRVLVQFAAQMQALVQSSDHLLRWSESAFLAVVRDTDRQHAEALAERIRVALRETHGRTEDGLLLHLSCSIGFACLPFLPNHPRLVGWKDAVDLAGLALGAAKMTGGDAWVGLCEGSVEAADSPLAEGPEGLPRRLQDQHLRIVSSKQETSVLSALSLLVSGGP